MRVVALVSLAPPAPDHRAARAPTGQARVLARARASKKWARIVAPASSRLPASPRAPASRGRHQIAVRAGDRSGDGRATKATSITARRFPDGTFETAPTLDPFATRLGVTQPADRRSARTFSTRARD